MRLCGPASRCGQSSPTHLLGTLAQWDSGSVAEGVREVPPAPPAPPSGVAGLLGHRQTHFSAPPTGLCRERVEEDLGLRLGQSFLLMLVVSLPSHFPVNVSIFCDRVKPCPVFAWLGLG